MKLLASMDIEKIEVNLETDADDDLDLNLETTEDEGEDEDTNLIEESDKLGKKQPHLK